MTCLFLPVYITNDSLAAAVALYGKVLEIRLGVFEDHPTLKTGTRYIRIEMCDSNTVPNFHRVAGHRATFYCRGIRRVCRGRSQERHIKAACTTEYCTRCATSGHALEGYTADCGRCSSSYASVDFPARRSYSSVFSHQVSLSEFH